MDIKHKEFLNEILSHLGGELDITKTQYEEAVRSYQAVGKQLTKENSELIPYNPEILPQGSFMLGTMIRPVVEGSKLDVDLVCQLTNKSSSWTQFDLKQIVGNQLKENDTYRKMLKQPDGKRCWTLEYAEDSNYHMDILPCVVDSNYALLMEKKFSNEEFSNLDELAIRITDKLDAGYQIITNHLLWKKSNPFGYAKWFFKRAIISTARMISLKEAIQPLKNFDDRKFPLQRIVQILKRHRDIMFSDESDFNLEHKPISIIITTLAAKSYDKEDNLVEGLKNVVANMRREIKPKWNNITNRNEKWIENPVNPVENFADKWPGQPLKEKYFYMWLDKLEADIEKIMFSEGIGIYNLQKIMAPQFGDSLTEKTFTNYGNSSRILTETGKKRMELSSGILGTSSTGPVVKKHDFEGKL